MYREADFRRPCAGCAELATWTCECCDEPRCVKHVPEENWCDDCEERFARSLVREGLYMVRADSSVTAFSRRDASKPPLEKPAYWSARHELRRGLPVLVPLGLLGALGVVTSWDGSFGEILFGVICAAVAVAFAKPALRVLRESPEGQLEREIAGARTRFLESQKTALRLPASVDEG